MDLYRSSRLANILENIGCDCSGGKNCYRNPTPSFVGLTQACTLQHLNYTVRCLCLLTLFLSFMCLYYEPSLSHSLTFILQPSISTDKTGIPPLRLFASADVQFSYAVRCLIIITSLLLIRLSQHAVR